MPRLSVPVWSAAFRAGDVTLSELEEMTLMLLLQHRLLSSEQLHGLLCPTKSERWMQWTLQKLHAVGLADRLLRRGRGYAGYVWFVTDAGRQAVDYAVRERHYVITAQRAGSMKQRHTLACNDVGVAFVRAAQAAAHECGPLDWEHEVAHRIADGTGVRFGNLLTSDLRIRCLMHDPDHGDVAVTRLVELDRATMNVLDVHQKVRSYVRMLKYAPGAGRPNVNATPAWKTQYQAFPKLLCVFTDKPERVLERRQDALADLCRADPVIAPHLEHVGVFMTTLARLDQDGPFTTTFRTPLRDSDDRVDILGRAARARPRP